MSCGFRTSRRRILWLDGPASRAAKSEFTGACPVSRQTRRVWARCPHPRYSTAFVHNAARPDAALPPARRQWRQSPHPVPGRQRPIPLSWVVLQERLDGRPRICPSCCSAASSRIYLSEVHVRTLEDAHSLHFRPLAPVAGQVSALAARARSPEFGPCDAQAASTLPGPSGSGSARRYSSTRHRLQKPR
jgi:hypothetical protein